MAANHPPRLAVNRSTSDSTFSSLITSGITASIGRPRIGQSAWNPCVDGDEARQVDHTARERYADEQPETFGRGGETRDRPSVPGRHQLEEQPPSERHHSASGDRDDEHDAEVPVVPTLGRPAAQQAEPVDDRGQPDHTCKTEAITYPPGHERGNDIRRHRAEHRLRHEIGRSEPDGDVEQNERARTRERPFPRRVRDQEPSTSGWP